MSENMRGNQLHCYTPIFPLEDDLTLEKNQHSKQKNTINNSQSYFIA